MVLANKDYDVFIGNTRGTFYGRKHVSLDPVKDAKKSFDYSFYEHG